MQIAAAIALSLFYLGITLAWGGLSPESGSPRWVFAPLLVTFGAAVLGWWLSESLPRPWAAGRPYRPVPRPVHLSWRTSVRLPAYVPMLVYLYYIHRSLSLHFHVAWAIHSGVALAGLVTAFVVRRCRREIGLLRDGQLVLGVVNDRSDIGEGPDRLSYQFTTSSGTTISGHGWDVGYGLTHGSRVPVFYSAADPRHHILASASWFEAD